jgi:hypothetical protein
MNATPACILRGTAVAIAALALTNPFSGNAWAREDPGEPAHPATSQARSYLYCPLERIGRQLVRCDNRAGAGAGALAPLLVPEQKPAGLCTAHIRTGQK